LKGKIPFLSRSAKNNAEKTDEEMEESEASADEDSTGVEEVDDLAEADQPKWKQALTKQLPFLAKVLNKPSARAASSGDKTDVGVKAPGANDQRQKIIRIALVLGALYFAYDYLNPAEETTEVVEELPVDPPVKKNKKKRPPPGEAASASPPAEGAVPVEGAAPVDPAVPTEPVVAAPVDTAPVDPAPVDTAPTETPAPVEPVVDAPPEQVPPPVESVDIPVEPIGDEAPISEDSAPIEATAPDDFVEPTPDLIPPEVTEPKVGGEAAPGTDQVTDGQPVTDNPDMTEQILKDLEKQIQDKKDNVPATGAAYIEPPDYENFGRGLVYNCRGKHWACVDGASYRVCEQNYSSLKGANKPKECYPDSVFQTDKACIWMQKERITAGTKTVFCQ
jgi:hypothetical protein